MKTKIFSMTLLALFLISAIQAQESSVGIKGGLNLSTMSTDGNNDENLKAGFHVGVFNKIALSESFAIQPEVMYSSKGLKISYEDAAFVEGETKFTLHYIDVPVKLVFNLSRDFEFQFGPYVGYLMQAKITNDGSLAGIPIESDDEIDRDNFKSLDYGLTAGLGFDLDPLIIGVNYNLGLSKVADGDVAKMLLDDAKNNVIMLSAGLKF